jgi:hypothetical protein
VSQHRLVTERPDWQRIQEQRANLAKAERAYREAGAKQWPWTNERRKAAVDRGEMLPIPDRWEPEACPLPEVNAHRISSYAEFHVLRTQLAEQETQILAGLYRNPEVRQRADELLREAMPHVEALLPITAELTELADLIFRSRGAAGQAAGLEPRGRIRAADVVDAVLNPDLDVIEPVHKPVSHFAAGLGAQKEPRVTVQEGREAYTQRVRFQRMPG